MTQPVPPDPNTSGNPRSRSVVLHIVRDLVNGHTLSAADLMARYGWTKRQDAHDVLKEIETTIPWIRVRTGDRNRHEYWSDLTVGGEPPRAQAAPSTWFEMLALQACRGLLQLAADTELRRAIDAQLQRAVESVNHGPVPDLSRVFRSVWRAPDRISHTP